MLSDEVVKQTRKYLMRQPQGKVTYIEEIRTKKKKKRAAMTIIPQVYLLISIIPRLSVSIKC